MNPTRQSRNQSGTRLREPQPVPQVQSPLKLAEHQRRPDVLRLAETRSEIFAASEDSDGVQCKERKGNCLYLVILRSFAAIMFGRGVSRAVQMRGLLKPSKQPG